LAAQQSTGRQDSHHLPKLPSNGNLCGRPLDVFIFLAHNTDSFRSIMTPRPVPVLLRRIADPDSFGPPRIRVAGRFSYCFSALHLAPERKLSRCAGSSTALTSSHL
jgi:hypothetical protein